MNKKLIALVACAMLLFPGCSSTNQNANSGNTPSTSTTPTAPSLLTQLQPALTTLDRAAVSELGLAGFNALAKKSPDTVTASVTALQSSLEGDILPWLTGTGPLSTGNSISALLNQKLLNTIPAEVKLALQGTIDTAVALLNVPAANQTINPTDLGYLVAAVQGLDDACKAYLSSLPATPAK